MNSENNYYKLFKNRSNQSKIIVQNSELLSSSDSKYEASISYLEQEHQN